MALPRTIGRPKVRQALMTRTKIGPSTFRHRASQKRNSLALYALLETLGQAADFVTHLNWTRTTARAREGKQWNWLRHLRVSTVDAEFLPHS